MANSYRAGNILRTRSFNIKTKQRLQRLRDLTYSIDQQARLSGELELIAKVDNYHGELITLLAPGAMFVGNLPFNNLPVRQNPAFVGRGSELDLLQSTLLPDKSPVQLPCACLYGLAGVGKSQLALQFAYKHIDVFDAILWISAESEIKLRGSLGEIANGLGLVEGSFENIQDTKEAVMHWLHLHPRSVYITTSTLV